MFTRTIPTVIFMLILCICLFHRGICTFGASLLAVNDMTELAGDGGIGKTEDQDTITPVQSLLSVKATSNHNGSPESADGKQKTVTLRQKLSPPRQTVQQNSSVDGTGGSEWYEHLWIIFYTFCIISGQYINFEILKILCSPKSSPTSSRKHSESSTKKFFSIVALLLFAFQVLVCVGYVATALFVDGLTVANASLPKMIAIHSDRNDCILPEEHWKFTTAVSISSVAAIFSYGLMTVFILIFANIIQCASRELRSKEQGSTGCLQTTHSDALSEYGSTEQDSVQEGSGEQGARDQDREQGTRDQDREQEKRDQDSKRQKLEQSSSEEESGSCSEHIQKLWDGD